MEIKKILVPVVFLDGSLRVVQQATYLARHFKAEIVLLHVVEPLGFLEGLSSGTRELHEEMISKAKEDLEESLKGEFTGIAVTRRLAVGHPADKIVETADSEGADLITMSTRGQGSVYKLLLGSVTSKVLHRTETPVWTGAHIEDAPAGEFAIRNILCAVDLTAHAVGTLKKAAQLASAFGAQLTVGHVTEGVKEFGPGGTHVVPAWQKEELDMASSEIARLQKQAGTSAEVAIDSGSASRLLGEIAERTKADVMVIGRKFPASHLGANGDGYSIIRDARVPVLSL